MPCPRELQDLRLGAVRVRYVRKCSIEVTIDTHPSGMGALSPGIRRVGQLGGGPKRCILISHGGGASGGIERASTSGGIERTEASGGIERAGTSGGIERAGASGGIERAGASGGIERASMSSGERSS